MTPTKEVNVHYSGKIVEYQRPPKVIHEKDINREKKARYIYHSRQEIKITDSIFFALQNAENHLYFITLTYQWKDHITYGIEHRKKCNKDLNLFLKSVY